jgi:hypothetical protein
VAAYGGFCRLLTCALPCLACPAPASFTEEREVEQHFMDTKYLLPSCHRGYWLGYRATSWPKFQSLVSSCKGSGHAGGVSMPQLVE